MSSLLYCYIYLKKLKQNPNYFHHDILKHSVCIPKACKKIPEDIYRTGEEGNEGLIKYINECYSEKFIQYDLKGRVENLSCNNTKLLEVDGLDILVA